MTDTPSVLDLAREALAHDKTATAEWKASGISPSGGMHRMDLRVGGARVWRSSEFFFHQEPMDEDDRSNCTDGLCCDCGMGKVVYDQQEADIHYAAFSRTALPLLAREVIRLHEERERVATRLHATVVSYHEGPVAQVDEWQCRLCGGSVSAWDPEKKAEVPRPSVLPHRVDCPCALLAPASLTTPPPDREGG